MLFKDDESWKPVITTKQVIEGSDNVAYVTYDEEGDWQAFGFEPFYDDDLDAISIEEMLEKDPTLALVPDLERGETASRGSMDLPWRKEEE